jgi:hypothetical protein
MLFHGELHDCDSLAPTSSGVLEVQPHKPHILFIKSSLVHGQDLVNLPCLVGVNHTV